MAIVSIHKVSYPESKNEFRLKGGSRILGYIRQFSATEKVILGVLVITAAFSALAMTGMISSYFLIEVPGKGGQIREGLVGLPHNINPVLAITDVDNDIATLVYSGLMKYDGQDLETDLAESYKISDDGLVYAFKLKSGLYFQDGTPLTSDDIAYTIQKIQDPGLRSPLRSNWTDVTTTVIGPLEIKFTLKKPFRPFLTNTTVGILPKHIWSSMNNDQFALDERNIEPIGSGPYKIASIERKSNIQVEYRLTTWTKYYSKKPYIPTISFVFFADRDKALSALETKTIDSLGSISPSEAVGLDENVNSDYEIRTTTLPRIFGLFFNQNQNPVLADKNVREALEMTVDREALVKTILLGYGLAIDGPLPEYAKSINQNNLETRNDLSSAIPLLEKAGAVYLLEKNGWKKNVTTGIYEKKNAKNVVQSLIFDIYTVDTPDLKKTAEMIRDSWKALGASVEVKVFESADLYQNIIKTRKYDILLFGEHIGKDNDIYAFWHSSQRNAPGLNVAMYTNNKVDALLDEIRTSDDAQIREKKYVELKEIIKKDIPAIFLYSPNFIYVTPKSLGGLDLGSLITASDRLNSIQNWYVNTEKIWKIFVNKI
mgnify:CR=1 FL=1